MESESDSKITDAKLNSGEKRTRPEIGTPFRFFVCGTYDKRLRHGNKRLRHGNKRLRLGQSDGR